MKNIFLIFLLIVSVPYAVSFDEIDANDIALSNFYEVNSLQDCIIYGSEVKDLSNNILATIDSKTVEEKQAYFNDFSEVYLDFLTRVSNYIQNIPLENHENVQAKIDSILDYFGSETIENFRSELSTLIEDLGIIDSRYNQIEFTIRIIE